MQQHSCVSAMLQFPRLIHQHTNYMHVDIWQHFAVYSIQTLTNSSENVTHGFGVKMPDFAEILW